MQEKNGFVNLYPKGTRVILVEGIHGRYDQHLEHEHWNIFATKGDFD